MLIFQAGQRGGMDYSVKTKTDGVEDGSSNTQQEKNKLQEFAESSTMHGLRYAFTSSYPARRRVTWLLVILAMVVGFLATFIDTIVQYFKYESVVNIKVESLPQLNMPSVSFCNVNVGKYSKLMEYSPEYTHSLIAATGFLASLPIPYIPVPDVAKNLTWQQFHESFGYGVDELFVTCDVGGIVDCAEYITQSRYDNSNCFTFNSEEVLTKMGNIAVLKAGHEYGVNFFLDVATQDYGHPKHLGEGVKAVVHSPESPPFVGAGEQFLAPGREYFYSLKRKITKRLPFPYSKVDCVDDDEKDIALSKHNLSGKYDAYTYSSCVQNCKMQTTGTCGCSIDGQSLPMCTMYQFQTCVIQEYHKFYSSGEDCGCLPTCTQNIYETQASFLDFPNSLMGEYLPFLNWTVDTVDEIRERYIQLHIYFDTLEVEEREQIPRIDIVQLFSNFGGLMGLYMGASIVTVIEFCDMLISTLCAKCKRKKVSQAQQQAQNSTLDPKPLPIKVNTIVQPFVN